MKNKKRIDVEPMLFAVDGEVMIRMDHISAMTRNTESKHGECIVCLKCGDSITMRPDYFDKLYEAMKEMTSFDITTDEEND